MATKRQLRERWKQEPGATIRGKIQAYIQSTCRWRPEASREENDFNQRLNSDEIFRLLDDLPFRDEVRSGRDLRGADLGSGWRSDFSDTDFSYSKSLENFFHSNLTNAQFNEITAERTTFGSIVNGASFKNAKLRACYIDNVRAQSCCFDGANIYHTSFIATDLSGSSFRNASCKGVSFAQANLTNCDFRGANLEEAIFRDVLLDKLTDFRGASLINATHDDGYDNAGNLLLRGVDLRCATYDETTKFGTDPTAFPLEIRQQAIEIARRDYGAVGEPVVALCQRLIDHLLATRSQDHEWEKAEISKLTSEQRQLYEQIMDDTYKSLL